MPDNRSVAQELGAQFAAHLGIAGILGPEHAHVAALKAMLDEGVIMYVDPEERHKIQFTLDAWFIMHPLSCRRDTGGNLFECDFTRIASEQFDGPEDRIGIWECAIKADGETIELLDRVPR